VNAYASLLANAQVRRLVAGAGVARLPTAMLPLAILLLVVETTGSIAAAGLISGAFSLGRAVVSPSVGSLIDRAGQTRVLIAGSALQAALVIALVAAAEAHLNLLIVGGIATISGAASPPVQASLRALWPQVTRPAQRDAVYSFDATSQELIFITGPLLVAAILGIARAGGAVVASAVLGCAGVAIYATARAARDAPRAQTRLSLGGALLAPGVAALAACSALAGFSYGALSFGLSALAVQLGQRQWSGLLLATLSVGSISGGLLYGSRSWRAGVADRYRVLFALCAVAVAPLVAVGSIAIAIPVSVLAGLPLAPLYAASYVLTGKIAPRGRITEAFTWTSSTFALGVGLGSAVSGVSVASAGVRAAFVLACVAPLAGWLLVPLIRDGRGRPERAEPWDREQREEHAGARGHVEGDAHADPEQRAAND